MELFSTAHYAQLFEMHQQFHLQLRSIGKTMSVRFDFAPYGTRPRGTEVPTSA